MRIKKVVLNKPWTDEQHKLRPYQEIGRYFITLSGFVYWCQNKKKLLIYLSLVVILIAVISSNCLYVLLTPHNLITCYVQTRFFMRGMQFVNNCHWFWIWLFIFRRSQFVIPNKQIHNSNMIVNGEDFNK